MYKGLLIVFATGLPVLFIGPPEAALMKILKVAIEKEKKETVSVSVGAFCCSVSWFCL